MAGLSFGFGGSSSKSYIDPQSRAAYFGNLDQANALPGFQGFSQGLLSQFQNPYTDDVVKANQADIERQRQMAVNSTGDAAQAAGAFGGSRHGVAESLTNEAAMRQGGLMSAQLRDQSFTTALQAAMQQMLAQNEYGLQRQGTINQSLSLLRPNQRGNSTTGSMGFSFGGS